MRAQGTIEYLTIVGIIVIIGLLVASTISGLTDSKTSIRAGKVGNLTGEITIREAVTDNQGDMLLILGSKDTEPLTITKITSGTMSWNYSKPMSFTEEKAIYFDTNNQVCICTGNTQTQECLIDIYYTTQSGVQQHMQKTITIECVTDANTPKEITVPYYHCADYTKDRRIDGDEVSRVLWYRNASAYYVNPAGYDGYAAGTGSHDGPTHCEDSDKDWSISTADVARVEALWRCPNYYTYDLANSTWKCA